MSEGTHEATSPQQAAAIVWPPSWPRVLDAHFGAPRPGGYRATPEDFQVEEQLGFEPEGQGEHLWLWLEKRDLTTAMVARRLARACEVTQRDVGYAGMKDRHAVTRQWFSVHLPGREAPDDLEARLADLPLTLLEVTRHPRKLKRGVHAANRFRLRVTGEALTDPHLAERWAWLCHHGAANYFGPQRFGADGRNIHRAAGVLARGWRKRDDREGMLLSAARSYLFNELLAARIEAGDWATPLPGEAVILDGSSSQFVAETVDDSLIARAERLDLHPSGVLWGQGRSVAQGEALAREQALAEAHPALCDGLVRAGVKTARRPLRLRLAAPRLAPGEGEAWFSFTLPRGAFATAVLRELIAHPTLSFHPPRQGPEQGAADASTAAVQ
ncbi:MULTISPECIES: tRNA pseudouridine(13) synthase TruD [Halomonas]|uniref:tRNA pseudouridine synthase D n=1 Tax=Halomonas halophila TaxID=29573 RepID=A0ABQ0U373_9GAMM|nr:MULTISPECIES: tRNA pseudouridine(13) synthase TruD [Halomonas]MDR5888843.1 tRNA pseudouridine(13) synthase TruD [Halomonas salina]RAH38635.1 tRNA pseudouridine(13) synthase TruD [Halomonas sp. SL1]WJY08022.1 tRNA pseudouridine(13) synthase TruD [Halomonas halophila]GEK72163.1 tRNA pseudouridine synthase D [Halomonas halophila]